MPTKQASAPAYLLLEREGSIGHPHLTRDDPSLWLMSFKRGPPCRHLRHYPP
jgi:hypothetical protein